MRFLWPLVIFCFQSFAQSAPVKVRLGWQVPWATQGQIVQVWKNTDILQKRGLQVEFIGRTYGPMLNELALANEVDVILTADQPAATLFAKDRGWVGIGRLMYNRTLTYVPPKSPIQSMKELSGKTIGLPVGAAAERVTLAALKRDGARDFKIVNLGIQEQGPLVMKAGDSTTWGPFDALAGFDPVPAIFEAKGRVRVIDTGRVVSMVVAHQKFLDANPQVGEKLMLALIDAYDHYRQNPAQANTWFMQEAQLKEADQKACEIAAAIEPNLKAKNRDGIRVIFSEADFHAMQAAADFLEPQLKKKVEMRKFMTNRYAGTAK